MIKNRTPLVVAAIVATTGISPGVLAQPQSTLLGIPFGEKLSLSQCPANTDHAKSPCWIGRPFVYKPTGSRSGSVHLPNPAGRPDWAANATFQIQQDKDGRVQELKVQTFSSHNRLKIAESISRRFGSPIQNQLQRSGASWASWRSADGYVDMQCENECWIDFRTPASQAAREAELAERARLDATRPKAP